jgi:transcriptional regulator with XRE-family HTH domain
MDWDTFKNDKITSISKCEGKVLDARAKFIDSLVKIRVAKKISQQTLSRITGLKQSAISRFESGNSVPRLDTVFAIAHALDCFIIVSSEKDSSTL